MTTNLLVQTLKESAKRMNLNRTIQRVALISLFIFLAIGNAWATSHSTHYGKAVLQNATGNGTVYLSTASGSNSGQSGSSTPGELNGTSWITWNCGENRDNDSKTYYARGTGDDGYYFAGWATSSTATSYTASTTGKSFSASSTTEGSPTTTTIYGFFKPVTVTAAPSVGIIYATDPTATYPSTAGETASFTTANSNKIGDFTTSDSGDSRIVISAWTRASATSATFNYKLVGNGSYGTNNRTLTKTVTLTSKGDASSTKSCTLTAKYPNPRVIGGENQEIFTAFKAAEAQIAVTKTAVFDVVYGDNGNNFTGTFSGEIGGGAWNVTGVTVNQTTQKATVTYTFNGNKAVGTHQATLTLTANDCSGWDDAEAAGSGSASITITAENEQESDYDVSLTTAGGETTNYETWAAGLAAANASAGCTLTLLRNIDLTATYGLTATQAIKQTFTLDLNGKTLSASINGSVLNPQTAGKTLTIKDSKTGGRIQNITPDYNGVTYGVNISAGEVVLESGTIHAENNAVFNHSSLTSLGTRAVKLAANTKFTMSGGTLEAKGGREVYGIYQESSSANNTADKSVVTISGGTIKAEAPALVYGIRSYGKVNMSGGTIDVTVNTEAVNSNTSYVAANFNDNTLHRYGYGIRMYATSNATLASNYFGTLTMTGGTINVTNLNKTMNGTTLYNEHIYGVKMEVSPTGAGAGKTAPDGTKVMKACAIGSIENATITLTHTGVLGYGVIATGCYNSFDNKTTPLQIKNSTINVTTFQTAYGVYADAYVNWSSSLANHTGNGGCTYGNIELTNTTINATTTGGTGAYCGWAACTSGTVADAKATTGSQSTGNATYCGEYAAAGKITVNSGTYTASAATSSAYGFGSSDRAKTVRSIKGALISRDAATDPLGSLGGNAEAYPELYIHGGKITATTGTAGTARAVKSGGTTIIDGGEFEANAGTSSAVTIAVHAGKTTVSGVTLKAEANSDANAVYVPATVSEYSLYGYAGEVELNNVTATVSTRTGDNARGVYVNRTFRTYTQAQFDAAKSGNTSAYQSYGDYWQVGTTAICGKATINGGTYTVTAENNYAYGVIVPNDNAVSTDGSKKSVGYLDIKNATFNISTRNLAYAYGVHAGTRANVEGCTITATAKTSNAYGVTSYDEDVTVKNCNITNTATTSSAYGIMASGAVANNGVRREGVITVDDCTVTTSAGTETAYAVYATGTSGGAYSTAYYTGSMAVAGKITVNSGKYTASAGTKKAYAAATYGKFVKNEAEAVPQLFINGGKFKGKEADVYTNVGAQTYAGEATLTGGFYVSNTNLSGYIPEGYEEVPLGTERPEYAEGYRYEVAEEGMHGIYVCQIGSTKYKSLEEALQVVTSGQTILMIANYVMAVPGDYVLPSGATLLVPRSGQTTAQGTTIASNLRSNERVAPTPNLTLTFASGVNLASFGVIETGGLENDASGGSQTGCTHGAYGRIILRNGAHIDLESGSKLQCWGYITGDGTITAKSGSNVYEYFEIAVNKGGTILSGMISGSNKVFPVDNYFIQNIESEITYMPGSQAFASSGMYIQGNRPANSVKIVGPDNDHLFRMATNGSRPNMWVKKKYDPTTDRCTWTMNDGAQLSSINITISGYGMNSEDFVLPISSSMDIVMNYGTLSIASGQDVMLIPGSRIVVKKDATLQIPSGMKFYVWDVAQWGKGSPSAKYAWSSLYQPDRTTNPRAGILTDKTNLPSGELFVQGTVEVTGAFQTTAGGAYIHSTNEDAGQIVYKAAATATGKVYQRTDAGSDQQSATTSAKLQNGDGTYEATAGSASGDKWIYRDSKWVKVSTSGCFVVETISGTPHYYAHPKDWVEVTANSPDDHAYHVTADPTRFVIQGADCNWIEVIPSDGYYKCINPNSIYYNSYFEWSSSNGYWVEKLVTVKFDNQGSVTTYSNIPFKSRPFYTGVTPTKTSSNANYYYVWTGWDTSSSNSGAAEYGKQEGDLPEATGNVTYYAHFDQRYYQYNITFKNSDGTVLDSKLWNKGTTPSYEGTPTKAPTTSTIYTFNGTWTPAISVVSQAQEYVANYSEALRPYEVKFLNFDNAPLETKNVNYGSNPTYTGEEPYRAGTPAFSWDFTGWMLQSTGVSYGKTATLPSVAGPQIYIAEFEQTEIKYAITFKPENGDANETKQWKYEQMPSYSKGTPVKASTDKYEYTFAGWEPDVVVATQNTTYTATYTEKIRKYTIQFVDDDNSPIRADQVEYDATPTPPTVPTKQDAYWNYTFKEWSPAIHSVTGGETYTAVYTKTGRSYTVTLNNQSATTPGTASVTVNYNDAMPSITVPTKSYNDFGGYFSEVNGGGTKYYNADGSSAHVWDRAENNPVLYAKWTPAQYTITYKDQGNVAFSGSHESGYPTSHTYGTATTLKSATKTGYTFDGWYTSQDCSTGKVTELGATAFTANITLYAKWNINQYTISFNSNGGSAVADIKQNYNTAVTAPADPTKTGYTFAGWDPAVPNPMPAENTNCVAQWTINQYTISFNSNGGSAVAAITQNYNTAVTAPADPTKTGYTFAGWDPAVPNPMPAGNTNCVAQWTPVPYTINYILNGGSASNPTSYNIETATFTLNNPTRTGYTFAGWTGSNGSTPQTNVSITVGSTGDKTYTANWTPINYDITFANLNGNGSSQTIQVPYDQRPVSPVTPEKVTDCEMYPFTGWKNSANTFFDKDVVLPFVTGNETYTAQFSNESQKTKFTVSFEMNGHGVAPADQSVDCDDLASEPSAPTAEGYTFGGWFKEAGCTNAWNFIMDVVNGTTVLYAKWTINTHKFAWNWDGGSTSSTTYTAADNAKQYGTAIIYPANNTMSKTGYSFVGWSSSATTMPDYDLTIMANWTPNTNTAYTVKHYKQNLAGTGYDLADTDNLTGTTLTDVTPSRKSYEGFATPDAQTKAIYPDGTMHIDYYYTRNSYTLAWTTDGDALTGSYTTGSVKYGAPITAPNEPTKTGYTFAGWSPAFTGTMPAGNTTYAATWTPNANTAYTVNHYKQNLDGTYNATPDDTDNLTGTTATNVTPARKSYTGFTEPAGQTVSILADGSRVVTYQYTRNSYELTWNAAGGSISGSYTSGSVKFGAAITKPADANVTREHYTFNGWNTTPATTMPAAATTYTAQWTPLQYTVTWDATTNGGSCATASTTKDYNTEIGTLPVATKENCVFNGWFTASDGGTQITTATKVTADITYYAQFSQANLVATVTPQGSTTPSYSAVAASDSEADITTAWNNALSNTTSGCTLTLYKDVTVDYNTNINKTMTIDLNGHTISSSTSSTSNTRLFYISGAYTLTIEDSGEGGMISFTGSGAASYYAIDVNNASAVLTVKGGKIQTNRTSTTGSSGGWNATTYFSAAVYLAAANSRLNVIGGELVALATSGNKYAVYHNASGGWNSTYYGYTYVYGGKLNATTAIFGNPQSNRVTLSGGYYSMNPGNETASGYQQAQITISSGYEKQQITNASMDPEYSNGYTYRIVKSQCAITWNNYNGTLITTHNVSGGTIVEYNGTTPTRDETNEYKYTFDGWAMEAHGDKVYDDGFTFVASKDFTFYAHFEATPKYAITFTNLDGNGASQTIYVLSGTMPESPIYPEKIVGDNFYAFDHWEPNIVVASAPATYTAVFSDTPSPRTYHITFDPANGGAKQYHDVPAGEMPAWEGANPTKASDSQYEYSFLAWSPGLSPATAQATYTAVYTQTTRTYTITFNPNNGGASQVYQVAYGEIPAWEGAEPTKSGNTFTGWSPAIEAVTGDATYTAQYVASASLVATVTTTAGVTTPHTSWSDALTKASQNAGSTLKLYANVTNPSNNTSITWDMTLDLNGWTISLTNTTTSNLQLFNLTAGTLTIMDSGTGGKIFYTGSGNAAYRAIYVNGGSASLIVNSGIIEGKCSSTTNNNSRQGIAVYLNSGSLTINGGELIATSTRRAYTVYNNNTNVTITGGKLKASGSQDSYNVIFSTPNRVTASGGYFSKNTQVTAQYGGGTTDISLVSGYEKQQITSASMDSEYSNGYTYRVIKSNCTITWKDYDGSPIDQTTVAYGDKPTHANPTRESTIQYTYTFNGWSPTIVSATEDATYTATYTETLRQYTITWKDGNNETLKTEEVNFGSTPSYTGSTPEKAEDAEYSYTFNGNWLPVIGSVIGDAEYTAQFDAVSKETGDLLDIVDWTTTTLTINANGWTASGWPYKINGTPYQSSDRAADRTLTIPYSAEAGTQLTIKVQDKDETVITLRNYSVPFIGTTSGTNASSIIYVNEGTLTISANTELAALYVRPEASVNITNGTLTVGKLVLRTLPWQAAAISGNFTATETWYTRIAPNNRIITGPYAPITYESASYYQFALPRNCIVPVKDIKVSHGAKTTYGKAWLLKYYDVTARATSGAGDNWVALGENDYIQGGVGYEMSNNSVYYREFYFPLGEISSASLGTTTAVAFESGNAGINHAGWNIVASPLMSVYDNRKANPETGMKISWLLTDGSYDQGIPDYIYPAIPFSYQASEGQSSISFEGSSIVASTPHRAVATEEELERIQWIHLDVKDGNGIGDHTSILAHPARYVDSYKTGIDVAKQSLTATRAILYSSHAYGDMAFAGVADSLLEKGVALTVYSPREQELTISMRENGWLNRMAAVWLIDHETGMTTDLLWNDYTFDAVSGTMSGRFTIQGLFRAPGVATSVEDAESSGQKSDVRKVIIDQKIYILVNGRIYDTTGKLVEGK